ncbi:uncharacterized protein [Misgurnus anguillicaudatus]|uniref:uncharacterized protein isoform X2 n=1 Tax=Misgurnus anguillicaudatus TaxID=75329 RepID=UPI003CCF3C93
MQKKNRTTSHIQDEAVLLLEKLQALGLRGVLLLSKPGKKQNDWVSEVLAPRCQLNETSHTCLERIKGLYDIVIQGWTPQGASDQLDEPSSAPVEPPTGPHQMVTSDHQQKAVLNPPTVTTGPPAALIGRPKSPIGQTVSLLTPSLPGESQNLGKTPHSPEGPSAGSPVSLEKDEVVQGGCPAPTTVQPNERKDEVLQGGCPAPTTVRPNKRKDEVVQGRCPAPTTVRPNKRKECTHTVTGNQDYYPVKRVAKYKVIKGQKWKQVEWEPCKLCGKKWPLEWVADIDTC